MIDYSQQIVTALSPVLSTYYELYCDGSTPKPCITYCEYSNNDTVYGETLGHSDISYMIKLWTDSVQYLQSYALQIDIRMRELGFHRTSSTDLYADGQLCKVMQYEASFVETYEHSNNSQGE